MKYTDRFKTRPLSYSQLSSFEYDPAQWYDNYILGNRAPANAAMLYGSYIGDRIGTVDNPVTGLDPVGVKEYEMRANLGDIHIVGFADHYCPVHKILNENKTSDKHDRWTQAKVDDHGQLTMYALMLFLQRKVKPEHVTMYLNFIPVRQNGDFTYSLPEPVTFTTFETKRTTRQVLEYAAYIQNTVKLMEAYANRQ